MSLLASVAVRTAPTFWPAAVFSATLRAAVEEENTGGMLVSTAAATWKTAESPYRGRRNMVGWMYALLLPRGPSPPEEELGRPRRTELVPSASESASPRAPRCRRDSQPVQGKLAAWEVSNPSVPDSFFSLASSSQDPS